MPRPNRHLPRESIYLPEGGGAAVHAQLRNLDARACLHHVENEANNGVAGTPAKTETGQSSIELGLVQLLGWEKRYIPAL